MITKRIFRALMVTATMIISTTIVEAQRINREGLHKLGQRGEASPIVTVQATALESNRAIELAAAAQEASQAGLLNISAQSKKAKAIVGSWLDTVTVTDGPTFKSLSTYTEDGSVVFNDQGSVLTEPPFPRVFSAGHGVWVHQGGRTFSTTTLQLISDLKGDGVGNLLAVLKLRATITLNESGDSYSAVFKAEFNDPAGNLIASFEGTTEGQRIKAEPLP